MPSVIEYPNDEVTLDNSIGASRNFLVYDVELPLQALAVEGLPRSGDAHPESNFMRVASRQAMRHPNLRACEVRVTYRLHSSSAQLSEPFELAAVPDEHSVSVTAREVVESVPLLRARFIESTPHVPPDPADPPVEPGLQMTWQAEDVPTTRVQTVYTFRSAMVREASLDFEQTLTDFARISELSSRIIEVDGSHYLFRVSLISQASAGDAVGMAHFTMEYEFVYDPGVPSGPRQYPGSWEPKPGSGYGTDEMRLPAVDISTQLPLAPAGLYAVPPFGSVVHGPLALEEQSLTNPEFFARLHYDVADGESWRSLPGTPAGGP